jgi:heme-degrading monooxygenase HmoA
MTQVREGPVVLINIFTIAPENQAKLLGLLERATTESVSRARGFLGADLYRSLDGTRVTMHARWRSAEDYGEMRRSGGSEQVLAEAMAIATFEPGMYELAASFSGAGGQ